MNITLASAFRNSVPYLQRYLSQCDALVDALYYAGHRLSFVWGEGDSTDSTLAMLRAATWRFKADIVDCTHGGAEQYGSVVRAERFKQLAHVGAVIWKAIPDDCDVFVYVESDLIWEPATILGMVERLGEYPAISPMVLLDRTGWSKKAFYDTWGGVGMDGRHFEHQPPYNAGYNPDQPFQVRSMGSCMAFRGDIARRLKIDDDVFQGICRQIYEMGHTVHIDPTLCVQHL